MPEILKQFAYHKPSARGLEQITKLREAFSEIERVINDVCPPGREKSIAITKNQEAAMWAVKAVVYNDPTSVVEGQQDVVKE